MRNKVFSDKKEKTLQMNTKPSALFYRHNELGKVRSKYRLIPKESGGIEYRLGNRLQTNEQFAYRCANSQVAHKNSH